MSRRTIAYPREPMYNESTMKPTELPRRKFTATDEIRQARPFYWIVMIVLAVLYVLAESQSDALHSPNRLILFTVLMLLHAGLHWYSPRVVGNMRASVIYLAAQGGQHAIERPGLRELVGRVAVIQKRRGAADERCRHRQSQDSQLHGCTPAECRTRVRRCRQRNPAR